MKYLTPTVFYFCLWFSIELIRYEIKWWQKAYLPSTTWYREFILFATVTLWATFFSLNKIYG